MLYDQISHKSWHQENPDLGSDQTPSLREQRVMMWLRKDPRVRGQKRKLSFIWSFSQWSHALTHAHTHTHTHSDCFLEGLCEQLTGLAEGRTWGLESVSRDGHFTNPTDKHVSCFCNVYNTLSGLEQQGLCDGLCLHVHSMFNESSSCRLNHTDTQMSDWPTLCDPSRFWLKYQRRNVNNYI